MCIYGIFGTIWRFIISKEGKTFDPKKIEVLVKMPMLKTPLEIQVFNGLTLHMLHHKIFLYYGTNHQVTQKRWSVRVDY
jgi:hypothetical protein